MALAGEGPASALDMAVAEENALALGHTLDELMENAGRAIAEEAVRRLPKAPAKVAVLAGPGNNGGDGTCAAFYLAQWGYQPEVWMVRPPAEIRSSAARRCYDRIASRLPVHAGVPRPAELGGFPLVLDALLGTGQAGPPRGAYRDAVAAARESGAPILAVDAPTGLGSPEAIVPRWTVTLTAVKAGMTPATAGEIVVREIGIPPAAQHETGPGEFHYYPKPRPATDRPRPGRVVVIGGGPYAGAPALAALAALRSGVERATVLVPLPAADRVQSFSPDLVVHAVGEDRFHPADVPTIATFLESVSVDAVIVGMGVGRGESTLEAMRVLLPELVGRYPTVVDADALDALPPATPDAAPPTVATPNQSEFARVFGGDALGTPDERIEEVRRRASTRRVTLLAKGEIDLISDGRRTALNRHHPPALAVSGTGDVLAGVVGGLLARGVAGYAAARLGTYWVGAAGYRAGARAGPGLVASDVVRELGPALVAGLDRIGRRGEGLNAPARR